MEKLRRRKLNSVGSSGCDKKVVTPKIAVAFLREERFKEWKKESGKWRIPVSRECLSGHSEGFSPKNPKIYEWILRSFRSLSMTKKQHPPDVTIGKEAYYD